MFCPKCRTEYRKGFSTCADCELPLVHELPSEPPPTTPEYVKYVNLYSPNNEAELIILKSILDSENIRYFIRNDNFGSLEVGPRIGLFNAKMIEVQDNQYDGARELLSDYFEKIEKKSEEPDKKYTTFDKVRMFIEVLLFSWLMPGRTKPQSRE